MVSPAPAKQPVHQEMTPGSFANHLAAFSPLPNATRSVAQSPAYFSKKSPAAAIALQHHFTGGSSNSGGALGFDSPSAAALGIHLHLPGLDGITSSNVRGDEDERRRRIESILDMLRTRPGRVSEESVERLAKRTGLEYLWEGPAGGPRMLSIAGSGVLIDIDFKLGAVSKVGISFLKSPEAPTVPAPRAAAILLRELQPPPGVSAINATLTPFAGHLERLARLDKLSSPGLNCFEAIAGVHASLARVNEWEKRKLRESRGGDDDEQIEREVLCKRSGRPVMHARRRVGLSLEYWMQRRLVAPKEHRRDDVVGATSSNRGGATVAENSTADEESVLWAAVIECEHSPAGIYPSVRVSEDWVSAPVEKVPEQSDMFQVTEGPVIDWLEPSPTLLSESGADAMAVDSGAGSIGKLPDVRFIARLEPPVVVPLPVAYELYASVGIEIPQESLRATTFDDLLLQGYGTSAAEGDIRAIHQRRALTVPNEHDDLAVREHEYTLYVEKQDYGRVIEEIPFAHPRQLIAVLPILRQYALLSSILHTTLPRESTPKKSSSESSTQDSSSETIEESNMPREAAELGRLLADDGCLGAPDLSIDIGLSAQPAPRMTLVFPWKKEAVTLVFEIDRDGAISVVSQNAWRDGESHGDGGDEKEKPRKETDPRRVLEISEDLGITTEYLRRRLV